MAKGKFNLNSLLNNKSKSGTILEEQQDYNTTPKPLLQVIPISVYNLVPSKDNFYSVEQIDELKTSIELFGVKQNLIVRPLEEGKYKLIAGHRRRLASLALVDEGKKEYEFVPCAIEPEEDEILERLLLIATNATVRELTDWEKVEQVKQMRGLLEEYKKNEKLPGRIRDLIAQALNTSPTQIGRMDAIDKNLSTEFKEELKDGGLNISAAYELSGLTAEGQKEALKEYREKGGLSINDVKQKKAALQNKDNDPGQATQLGRSTDIPTKPQGQQQKPLEELKEKQTKETVFETIRKMSPEELADYLAKEMAAAFEWDIDSDHILKWLNKPMKG